MDSRFSASKNGPGDMRNHIALTPKQPPACVQNAMMNRDKKPFTYLPGGLDLSQIKSEKMARRLMINALSPGVQEKPKQPSFTPTPDTPPIKSMHYFNMPVAVFPCIQIPSNPKELLRRTSGPFCRSESVEKPVDNKPLKEKINEDCIPIKPIENKQINEEIIIKDCVPIKPIENKEMNKEIIIEDAVQDVEINSIKNITNGDTEEISAIEDTQEAEQIIEEAVIDDDESVECDQAEEIEEEDVLIEKPELPKVIDYNYDQVPMIQSEFIDDLSDSSSSSEDEDPYQECEKSMDNVERFKTPSPIELIPVMEEQEEQEEPEDSDDDFIEDLPVDNKVECDADEQVPSETKCDINIEENSLSLNEEDRISPAINTEVDSVAEQIDELKVDDLIKEEERVVSPMRRSTETIKGLSDDLDSLPSLNICTKRFSFLRDSPPRSEDKKVDDPFSIITGIPPKISLIDRVKNTEQWKPEENPIKPEVSVFLEPVNSNIYTPKFEATFKSDDDSWKPQKDGVSFKDFLNDDPEPAWKKEIREIAKRKAEAKEESEEYKVEKEPPWKRELRELTKAREAKLLDTNEITLHEPIYQTPWGFTNNAFYRPSVKAEENPRSQTLRPKSWKERNAETQPKEAYEWTPGKKFMESFIKKRLTRSDSPDANKAPEITVEVVNQPTYYPNTLNSNGYVYPWESSSESSIAFSPEPRTPTPQSRNSPHSSYSGYGSSSAVSKEYGTLSFQPRRARSRTCPIQSRSFKYLQLLTGTDDSYEDDEPFIPQPPQHAYPKPGNF